MYNKAYEKLRSNFKQILERREIMTTVLIIPALNPNKKLISLIDKLIGMGFERIVLVDDGSDDEYNEIFEEAYEYGCNIVYHDKNEGKGKAIKAGLKKAVRLYGKNNVFLTLDADGQHLPADVKKVAEVCMANPDKLVLGTRNFKEKNEPWKSKIGNKITSVYFKFETGVKCKDTQTGLRGIPEGLVDLALSAKGERYEYEMNFLVEAAKKTELVYVDISTVYEDNNKGSHFNPIKDSYRIYEKPIKYTSIAFFSSVADYMLFCVMLYYFRNMGVRGVVLATFLSRIASGGFNFSLNRKICFDSTNSAGSDATRYLELFVGQMCASAILVILLSTIGIKKQIGKIIVDTMLFFVSYKIQKEWVFNAKDKKQKVNRINALSTSTVKNGNIKVGNIQDRIYKTKMYK